MEQHGETGEAGHRPQMEQSGETGEAGHIGLGRKSPARQVRQDTSASDGTVRREGEALTNGVINRPRASERASERNSPARQVSQGTFARARTVWPTDEVGDTRLGRDSPARKVRQGTSAAGQNSPAKQVRQRNTTLSILNCDGVNYQ